MKLLRSVLFTRRPLRYAPIAVRRRLLDLVVCPQTGRPFTLHVTKEEGEEVIEGMLETDANTKYPIRGGVPRLLPNPDQVSAEQQDTVDRFAVQWSDFNFMTPLYEAQLLEWIYPNRPEDFKDKVVLEGGSGKGRHSALVGMWGARDVISVDLGTAIETTHANNLHLENVHAVQADLFHLPVKDGTIDMAFSVGVLHHTPDPQGAFRSLSKTVKPGGKVIAWVYGRENNGWIIHGVDPLRTVVTSRLPHEMVYEVSKVPAAFLWGVGRAVYKPLSKGPLDVVGKRLFYSKYLNRLAEMPFKEVHCIVHDHLTPTLAYYIRREEFEQWFADESLQEVAISWHNDNSWRGTGIVPKSR